MALTAKQRKALPKSAFVYPSRAPGPGSYPVPTKAQARRAGISEKARLATLRAAKAYAARRSTRGTPAKVNAVVRKRAPAASALAKPRRRRRTAAPRRPSVKRAPGARASTRRATGRKR
jgi:hypothetical protein